MSDSQDRQNQTEKSKPISRRSFIKGLGLTTAAAAAAPHTNLLDSLSKASVSGKSELLGPDAITIQLNVNGKILQAVVEPRTTLALVLRDQLQLTGTKIGCDRGACGACTVILEDKPVFACMTLVHDSIGHPIQTIEGLSSEGKLHKIQESFIEHDGLQCGFCTSGMIMSCKSLLDNNPNPSLEEVKIATSGNLCRCGAYPKVFEAVMAVGGNN